MALTGVIPVAMLLMLFVSMLFFIVVGGAFEIAVWARGFRRRDGRRRFADIFADGRARRAAQSGADDRTRRAAYRLSYGGARRAA